MKTVRFIGIISSVAILAACASKGSQLVSRDQRLLNAQSNLLGLEKVAEDKRNNLEVVAGYFYDSSAKDNDRYPAKYLHIVHPSHNSKMVAAKVFYVLASLPIGSQVNGHAKYDLRGEKTEIQNQSIPYVFQPVRDYVFKQFATAENATHKFFPLKIEASRFALVYDSYSGEKNSTRLYELIQDITFSKIREDVAETTSSKTTDRFVVRCEKKGTKYTLPEWEANDYKLLHSTAKEYAESCAQVLLKGQKADFHAAYIY